MRLGTCIDGRVLTYSESRYTFAIDGKRVDYATVLSLDDYARIHWCALEQRDWFRRIDPNVLKRCENEALAKLGEMGNLDVHEQVLADAARDDSVLAGRIVEADPALVHAVMEQLEAQGMLVSAQKGQGKDADEKGSFNPLATIDLPDGMEALSQMERAKGAKRDMTRAEKRLMKKILRNDDKAKVKREKEGVRKSEAAAGKESTEEE